MQALFVWQTPRHYIMSFAFVVLLNFVKYFFLFFLDFLWVQKKPENLVGTAFQRKSKVKRYK